MLPLWPAAIRARAAQTITRAQVAGRASLRAPTIGGDGPNGDTAISDAYPVEVNVSGDRVSGSGVFAALDGSGEYEGTFEFVCG
jgi:hypothetical protein